VELAQTMEETMTYAITLYFLIGLILATAAWHAAGKHAPIQEHAPKWVTLTILLVLWPAVLAMYVKLRR
jgi:hypothetical protein